MKTNYISQIIHRYFTDEYPPEMEKRLQAWLVSKDKASLKEEAILLIWNELETSNDESIYQSLQEMKQKLGFKEEVKTSFPLLKSIPEKPQSIYEKKRRRLRQAFFSLTAIALVCLIAGWWYHSSTPAQWIDISTTYGNTAQCLLPDGSTVWISPGTTLSYPKIFKGNSREVRLSGEARFSVSKDKKKPFRVRTNTCTIQVLGTVFRVSDYPENQQTFARLEEGSIEVVPANNKKYVLSPNQKIIIDKNARTIRILPTEITPWEEGELSFEDIPLHDIFQALKRHYGISIVYRYFHPGNDRYSIKFNQKENLEQALDLLQTLTENFIWSKHNNQIIIRSWHPSYTD